MSVTRLDYCQFLLSSQVNYTLTYFADHSHKYVHDRLNRYLAKEQLKPSLVWDNVKGEIIADPEGYLLFDDTVLDKDHSFKIELVRKQWSGNEGRVIKGIGVVTCVYVNPKLGRFWVIDFRIYDPDTDRKTKNDHVSDMLAHALSDKKLPGGSPLPFATVLMDSWYTSRALMPRIDDADKVFYGPVKSNRLVCDQPESKTHLPASTLAWSQTEESEGKRVHVKDFPKDYYLCLFRLPFSTERTDYVVTNAQRIATRQAAAGLPPVAQPTAGLAQQACKVRWKIEQAHRELKQTTGIDKCQCRKARIQRNHIACAVLVWVRLNALAHQAQTSIYQLKQSLLDNYMIQQLKKPSITMAFA
ncbi:MAG: transposase [Cytophagales bacterium]|nr:transposase [Cytophagales bacterium]